MKRIVIQLSELSYENWNCIYRFIERCLGNKQYSKSDFIYLKNNGIDIGIDENPNNCDVCSIADKGIIELQYETLPENGDYIFNIIYVKTDNREEFSDFTRFFLLKKKYAGRITLGINLDVLSIRDFNNYKFQLAFFFFFIKNKQPLWGENSLYIVRTEDSDLKAIGIPYMDDKKNDKIPKYEDASPFIFPLIPINRNNFGIFETHDTPKNERINAYIENSIINSRKKKELKNKHVDTSICHSVFEEWFLISYLASDRNAKTTTILSYCDNIRELVQNIIFHTKEQQGLLYIVFNKKSKISKTLHSKIPGFISCGEDQRFVEIGIFDYNETGIVETFSKTHDKDLFEVQLNLDVFLDPKKILPDKAKYISVRFAAHLGIKAFVSSVMYHKGYFRVESNKSIEGIIGGIENKERFENSGNGIVGLTSINNIDGTHYEIILPPIDKNSSIGSASMGLQTTSVSDVLKKRLKREKNLRLNNEIRIEECSETEFNDNKQKVTNILGGSKLKQNQEKAIKELGKQILIHVSPELEKGANRVAINISKSNLDISFNTHFLKLLAYLQPLQQHSGCLIFTQLDDKTIDFLCRIIDDFIDGIEEKGQPIWSDNHPIVLIGKAGTTRIFAGKTKNEMIYVNQCINSQYFSQSSFPNIESGNYKQPIKSRITLLDKLIMPYDCLIDSHDIELSPFISRMNHLLDESIDTKKFGCQTGFPTKIGSKLYVKAYYEADFLFQNNFFTDRFAYFIAKNIIERVDDKDLVLIGYNSYSAALTERVKDYVIGCSKKMVKGIIIAKEKDKEKGLNFTMSKDLKNALMPEVLMKSGKAQKVREDDINKNLRKFAFITIVPIASTLSTTDKIIALFAKKIAEKTMIKAPDIRFVYNYTIVLVRDISDGQPTENEIKRNWKRNGIDGHTIHTLYQKKGLNEDGMNVDFLIQKTGFWRNLIDEDKDPSETEDIFGENKTPLNGKGTFPKEWQYESYINKTKNASLNTKELFGLPTSSMPKIWEIKDELSLPTDNDNDEAVRNEYYRCSVQRLFEIRDFIHFGHINHSGSHHRYYFDVEQLFDSMTNVSLPFQNKNKKAISNAGHQLDVFAEQKEAILENGSFPRLRFWLKEYVRQRVLQNVLNIIITPDYDYESCYVSTINKWVFDDNAFVIYLNIHEPLQNSKQKLSYLKDKIKFQKTQYYFVGQALLTGNTYQKTRTYMASILDDEGFCFDGVITILNRLSKDRYREIESGLKHEDGTAHRQFFSYLHFFVLPSKELEKSCSLCELQDMFEHLIEHSAIEDCREEIERNKKKFEIQQYNRTLDEETKITTVSDTPKDIYSSNDRYWLRMIWRHRLFFELQKLSEGESGDETVFKCLDNLYDKNDPEMKGVSDNRLDNKISFLKAITFPPLSQYVKIRKYAHKLQLKELFDLFDEAHPDYDDISMLLVLLKHLAILGSNALVREEVIINSWKLYFRVIENAREKPSLITEKAFAQRFIFYIKLATYKDEAKSLWLGELLRKGNEMSAADFSNEFKSTETKIYNSFFHAFDNTGKELQMNKDCFRNYFLPLLYYDNTAITRKTLDNLEEAIQKDPTLDEIWYKTESKDEKKVKELKTFSEITERITEIVEKYKDKINSEYYYSWFRHFLNNNNKTADGVPLLEKYVYVVYERLLLRNLVDVHKQNTSSFDSNANDLLTVAAKVMSSDAAFIYIKDEKRESGTYLASYNVSINENDDDDYYFMRLLFEKEPLKKGQPFVIAKNLSDKGESRVGHGRYNRAAYLMLNRTASGKPENKTGSKKSLVGVVAFLYEDVALRQALNLMEQSQDKRKRTDAKEEFYRTHIHFMKNIQELGRLLLLLKPEMDEYVEHVAKEKQFEVWKEKQESLKRFEKVYSNSNHVFKSVFSEMAEFENLRVDLPEELEDKHKNNIESMVLLTFSRTWYWLTNEMISYLYANIEKNSDNGFHYLKLDMNESSIVNGEDTLRDVFSMNFIRMLKNMLGGRWSKQDIYVNGVSVAQIEGPLNLALSIPNEPIHCNKHIIQTFITQCLNNSLYDAKDGGHRKCSRKKANIKVTRTSIVINDETIEGDNNSAKDIQDFERKKPSIQGMDCTHYSCTTLTSLQGFINYMKKQEGGNFFSCDYGFEGRDFMVRITFNN